MVSTKDHQTFLAGTADGRVFSYSSEESTLLAGEGHPSVITGITASPEGDKAYSIGYDDHVREIDAASDSYLYVGVFSTPSS